MQHYRIECDWYDGIVRLRVVKFSTYKETPTGYWVVSSEFYPNWLSFSELRKQKYIRWISKTSIKRYCYPTIDEALKSFECRKKKQLQHVLFTAKVLEVVLKGMEGIDIEALERNMFGVKVGSFDNGVFSGLHV